MKEGDRVYFWVGGVLSALLIRVYKNGTASLTTPEGTDFVVDSCFSSKLECLQYERDKSVDKEDDLVYHIKTLNALIVEEGGE